MKLIIDIPENVKAKIDDNINACDLDIYDCVMIAVKNGIPLDKIRAEIESLQNANPSYWHSGDMVEREEVFEIIDKYKEENHV